MDVNQKYRDRIELLVSRGSSVLATHSPNGPGLYGFPTLDRGAFASWRTQSLSFLTNLLGAEHIYVQSFAEETTEGYASSVKAGIGIMKAVCEDLEDGFLSKVRVLVSAEVFTDFLDMVGHLLECGYKDASATLCGAVLEQGLRRIATNTGIQLREQDNLNSLNQRLADADIYTRLEQRRLVVWINVRNSADHGKFSEYSLADVTDMYNGVSSFLAQHLKS